MKITKAWLSNLSQYSLFLGSHFKWLGHTQIGVLLGCNSIFSKEHSCQIQMGVASSLGILPFKWSVYQVFLMPRAWSFDCDPLTITLYLFKKWVCLWQQHLGDSLVKETLSLLNFSPVTQHGDGMKQDLCLNWYQPLHYPPSKWKVVQHHRGPHPLLFTNTSVGSFTSHKNQNSARAVRRGLRFFFLIQED